METYSFNSSYPDSSGDSFTLYSPEIEFEKPPPYENLQNNYKVKLMCSYRGKIHLHPNGKELSYIGGETKILTVDRNIKFSSLLSKIIALCGNENVAVKYQLPGENMDALISVTNDDDLESLMHEYDRLFKLSQKPARLRLFIFLITNPSIGVKSEKVLNSGSVTAVTSPVTVVPISADSIEKNLTDLQRLRIEGEYRNNPAEIPAGYWPENQQVAGGIDPTSIVNREQPLYMIPSPASAYHAPMLSPFTAGQGYYAVQRIPPEVYREQQVYNLPPLAVPKPAGYYSDGFGFVQSAAAGGAMMAYDNGAGRQVIYSAPGGIMPPPQHVQPEVTAAAINAET